VEREDNTSAETLEVDEIRWSGHIRNMWWVRAKVPNAGMPNVRKPGMPNRLENWSMFANWSMFNPKS